MKLQSPDDVADLLVAVLSRVTGFAPDRIVREGGPRPSDGPHLAVSWLSYTPNPQNCGAYDGDPDDVEYPANPTDPTDPTDPADPSDPTDPTDPTDPADADCIQVLGNTGVGVMRVLFRGEGAFSAAVKAWGWLQNDNRVFDLWAEANSIGYGGLASAIIGDSPRMAGREIPGAHFDLQLNVSFAAAYPVDFFDASTWQLAVHSGDSEAPRKEEHVYP